MRCPGERDKRRALLDVRPVARARVGGRVVAALPALPLVRRVRVVVVVLELEVGRVEPDDGKVVLLAPALNERTDGELERWRRRRQRRERERERRALRVVVQDRGGHCESTASASPDPFAGRSRCPHSR